MLRRICSTLNKNWLRTAGYTAGFCMGAISTVQYSTHVYGLTQQKNTTTIESSEVDLTDQEIDDIYKIFVNDDVENFNMVFGKTIMTSKYFQPIYKLMIDKSTTQIIKYCIEENWMCRYHLLKLAIDEQNWNMFETIIDRIHTLAKDSARSNVEKEFAEQIWYSLLPSLIQSGFNDVDRMTKIANLTIPNLHLIINDNLFNNVISSVKSRHGTFETNLKFIGNFMNEHANNFNTYSIYRKTVSDLLIESIGQPDTEITKYLVDITPEFPPGKTLEYFFALMGKGDSDLYKYSWEKYSNQLSFGDKHSLLKCARTYHMFAYTLDIMPDDI